MDTSPKDNGSHLDNPAIVTGGVKGRQPAEYPLPGRFLAETVGDAAQSGTFRADRGGAVLGVKCPFACGKAPASSVGVLSHKWGQTSGGGLMLHGEADIAVLLNTPF